MKNENAIETDAAAGAAASAAAPGFTVVLTVVSRDAAAEAAAPAAASVSILFSFFKSRFSFASFSLILMFSFIFATDGTNDIRWDVCTHIAGLGLNHRQSGQGST